VIVQYSERIRTAQMEQIVLALGPAAVMKIFSGDVPSSCDAADPVGEICELELPRRPFLTPDGGKIMIAEPWVGEAHASDKSTAKSFRVYDYMGEVHIQGTVSKNGEDGDLQLDTTRILKGQRLSIGAFTIESRND
jgi:hypothetical protein